MRLRKLIAAFAALVLAIAGLAIANNNYPRTSLTRAQFATKLDEAYAKGADWMLAQPREGNTYLTYMLRNCAVVSGDKRLQDFAERAYRMNPDPPDMRLIFPSAPFSYPSANYLGKMDDYRRWILHAIARREFPLTEADRAAMFGVDRRYTGKATHQLQALTLYREYNGETPELNAHIRRISEGIAQEQAFDFRVTDLYLQRIAFLLAAGQTDLVQPRWVERALARQQPSGAWYRGWYSWQSSPFEFDVEEFGNSHATTQGLWLACLIKYRYPQWIDAHYK